MSVEKPSEQGARLGGVLDRSLTPQIETSQQLKSVKKVVGGKNRKTH